jgi:DNA-binding protein H-NS
MNKVKGTYLEEVEVLEQEEEEEVQEEEVEEAMKENQVMKALHKDVIFARRVVMLRKIAGSRESHNVFIAKNLATCKKIIDY